MNSTNARLAVFSAADGPTNFARDDALLDAGRQRGEWAARVYAWDRAVVSFGRNERAIGRYDPARFERAGLSVVRRPTGGRALLHHHELTYSVGGPAGENDTLRSTYNALGTVLLGALNRLGIAAERAQSSAIAGGEFAPCFAGPAAGEITAGGRKLVASAQWRGGGGFVQHGSILIDNDQPRLADGLADQHVLPALPAPATLRDLCATVPTLDDFAHALAGAMRDIGIATERVAPDELIDPAFVLSRRAHYADAEWTWRR